MKYGIITYHGIPNLGAILQGFALCNYVRECGLECDIVNYKCKNLEERELQYHKASNPLRDIIKKILYGKKSKKKRHVVHLKKLCMDQKSIRLLI